MTEILAVAWIDDIGRSLRAGFAMFWVTLWPLVLGFTLSGFVQSFVRAGAVRRSLGDHRPAAVARASGYGMASSSCSYAAAAMAKSLFAMGADFVTSMAFMFASTNLVIELGIVLVVLMGWQFAVGEIFGGLVMIALLALVGGAFFTARVTARARERVTGQENGDHRHDQAGEPPASWRARLRRRSGWVDAATYTVGDLTMLRRELVIGYTVAGFLAALVPAAVWSTVFVKGHGAWTTLENVIVGPLVAVVSFVCSVGNVPLAAALWRGGISFGGVISFIFADLITFPLLLVYRRYYGGRLTLRMLAVFWALMSTAGLVTELTFRALGIIPTTRSARITSPSLSWNLTTWLDIAAVLAFAFVYWVYRNRDRLGAGDDHALDPVCGMQVHKATAPASTLHEGVRRYFCSDRCSGRFHEDPGRWAGDGRTGTAAGH